jgi:hypothetical protein
MEEPDDPLRAEALAFYRSAQTYEHHFNDTEFEIRKLASAWLLASFAAIAFLIRGELQEQSSLAGPLQLIVIVAALAQTGLFLLWILDQVVYHGLLDAAFTLALHIERRYGELPPLRSMMMRISAGADGAHGTGMARHLKLFYLIPMGVYALLAWAATWLVHQRGGEWVEVLAVMSAAITAIPVWVIVKTRLVDSGKWRNRPNAGDAYADRPYDLAVERWLKELERSRE